MPLKRHLPEAEPEPDQDFQLNKRLRLLSTIFKVKMEDIVPMLEPFIRGLVREILEKAIQSLMSESEIPESRNLGLEIESKLPGSVFTNNRIVSESIKIRVYDPETQETVTSGPESSMKVKVVAVQGDFEAEEWSKTEFESKVVESRAGKRPLLIGDVVVSLNSGRGYINQLCFTDNSSWIRSGKFRLGVRCCDQNETRVREGISNAFKVKDQRGEGSQKLYPPQLNSEVWRLEKIGKGGTYNKQLSKMDILNVGDFLRCYVMNKASLRAILHNISSKKWARIVEHAKTCIIDDKKYIYRDATGAAALLFDSICRLIAVTFGSQTTFHSLHALDNYHMRMVEDLKQRAYGNLNKWELYQGEVEIVEMKKNEAQGSRSSFELGGLTFSNSFGVADFEEQEEMAKVE